MAYEALTLAETAAKAPVKQALMRKHKGNFDDHETRVAGVEGIKQAAITDHFHNSDHAVFATRSFDSNRWKDALSGATINTDNTQHSITMVCAAVNQRARVRSTLRSFPTELPSLKARVKQTDSGDIAELFVGLINDRAIGTTPDDGVYLVIDGANAFFRAIKNGVSSDGSTFAIPADFTWFEVFIQWTAVDVIDCTVDGGNLKQFTSADNIPDTVNEELFGEVHITSDATVGTVNVQIDRIEHRITAIADLA